MTEPPTEPNNPDEPDQDASANKVDADEIDPAPTADKEPAEGSDNPAKTD